MPRPVEHAVSWWQYLAGWVGIRTAAWVLVLGGIVITRLASCRRHVARETHG
jgi:hypothetical protein